ncbi:hypothetical protein [Chelativorans sp.]|uniref:hypothetical protein n=1 Tax=Chelativorans sp. TaxID=2203393 RepID=UPI00281104F0|nr:hypothetical protein [Chelativorans sp.]
MRNSIFAAGLGLAGSVLLSACQPGGAPLAGLGGPAAEPPAGAVRESELRAFCPPVTLRDGTAFHTTYEGGAEGDPDRVVYLSSIGETTRACKYGQGAGSITVAIAGKVVPGPRGRTGNVTMPIRVVLLRGSDVISTQLYRHPVTIRDTAGATQFILNVPDIPVPGGIDRGVQVMVGFDAGGGR